MTTAREKAGREKKHQEYNELPATTAVVMLLKLHEVLRITGLGKTNLYGQIRTGDFPSPVRLGGPGTRAVAWRSNQIAEWVESRPVVRSGNA